MTNDKIYSLCEAVADISYIAAKEDYRPNDSREMINQFIEWAKEFEYIHRNIEWGINSDLEYSDSVYYFSIFKVNQWRIV